MWGGVQCRQTTRNLIMQDFHDAMFDVLPLKHSNLAYRRQFILQKKSLTFARENQPLLPFVAVLN